METRRMDEWKLEQGFAPKYTGENKPLDTFDTIAERKSDIFKDLGIDPDVDFKEEKKGWKGYVEWEKYPEKKKKAADILAKYEFPPPPEFQLGPIPDTMPVLEGVRWKMWHKATGGPLTDIPEISWKTVLEEKHKDMLHLLQFPYNGEPPKSLTTAQPITPNSLHFVRNHGGIPEWEPPREEFTLELDGLVKNPKTLTLNDLMNEELFPRQSSLVTIQCSGTRRVEQISEYAGEGDEMINAPWAEGAIGTARWTGVSLKKVIKHCGGLIDGAKHLELYGAETYYKHDQVQNYLVSVPWSKVKQNELLLAWEMNGEPLPKIHGYPLRVVVFGYIGARSVKWLYRIKAIKNSSRAPVQSKEYLYFNSQVGKHNQSMTQGVQIQEMPVSSAIMSPWTKDVVIHEGTMKVKGWAYSGGGRWPERVEVSPDGGYVWYPVPNENLSKKHKFAWRTWHIDLPVDAEGWLELTVRCWDNSLNTQPTYVRSAWNWGLHVTSSCHRVKVYSVNKSKPATKARLAEFEERGVQFEPLTRPTEFPTQSEEDYEKFWAEHDPRDVDD